MPDEEEIIETTEELSFIDNALEETTFNRILSHIAYLLLGLYFMYLVTVPWVNYLRHPITKVESFDELSTHIDTDRLFFADLTKTNIAFSPEFKNKYQGNYFISEYQGKYICVADCPPGATAIQAFTFNEEAYNELVEAIGDDIPLETFFFIYSESSTPSALAPIAVFIMCAWLIVFMIRDIKYFGDIERHPVRKHLASFDEDYFAIFDEELAQGKVVELKNLYISPTLIVSRTRKKLNVTRIVDLAWVYQKKEHTKYVFVPLWSSYHIFINPFEGKSWCVSVSKEIETAKDIVESIKELAPWIETGYDRKMSIMFELDKSTFLSAIEQRQIQFLHDNKINLDKPE